MDWLLERAKNVTVIEKLEPMPMYICVCHSLNEQAVSEAFNNGATTAGMVYRHHNVKPKCGKCTSAIQGMAPKKQTRECGNCGQCANGRK